MVIISFLMLSTFAVLVGTSLVSRAQKPQTTPGKLCSLNINAYVKEVTASGEETMLDFNKHPELFANLWGLYDKRRSNNSPIAFNQGTRAQYQVFTTDRAFTAFPQDQEIYNEGEKAWMRLAYQDRKYDLIRTEIKKCQKENDAQWLCTGDNIDQINITPDVISSLNMDCGMVLEFGWVVKADSNNLVNEPGGGQAVNKAADVNNDTAFNVLDLLIVTNNYGSRGELLSADVNGDGMVNALDYTLVVEAIQSQ